MNGAMTDGDVVRMLARGVFKRTPPQVEPAELELRGYEIAQRLDLAAQTCPACFTSYQPGEIHDCPAGGPGNVPAVSLTDIDHTTPLGQLLLWLLNDHHRLGARLAKVEAVAHEPVSIPIGEIVARLEKVEKELRDLGEAHELPEGTR